MWCGGGDGVCLPQCVGGGCGGRGWARELNREEEGKKKKGIRVLELHNQGSTHLFIEVNRELG